MRESLSDSGLDYARPDKLIAKAVDLRTVTSSVVEIRISWKMVIFANYFILQLIMPKAEIEIPIGTKTMILSKLYYGVMSKNLEKLDTERYFAILYYIQNNNGCCCQQDICDSLYVDKTAMVKILDVLTKTGFIERKVNPKDRRQHYISLSKKGEKQTKEISKSFGALDKQMFDHISEKDKLIFKTVLKQLTENLLEIPKNDLFFKYQKTK